MKIGSLTLSNSLILAPLAGFTDLPFRIMARRCGAGMVYSEMISANGLLYKNASTKSMLVTVPEERPVCFQLFGSQPETMGEAASVITHFPIDAIDINMGCPVRKVVSKNAGSALLRNLPLAASIIRAVVRNSSVSVTVKIRLGWDNESIVAPDLARMAEAEGASAVIVHGRTSRQMFGGRVNLEGIRKVREAVSIPVIGNGDVKTKADIDTMKQATGCEAVMIGRGALGNPWIFSTPAQPSSQEERLTVVLEHLNLMEKYLSPREALVQARNHAGWYSKGLRGSAHLRATLFEARTIADIGQRLFDFFSPSVPGLSEDSCDRLPRSLAASLK